jgi:hypothetical protein
MDYLIAYSILAAGFIFSYKYPKTYFIVILFFLPMIGFILLFSWKFLGMSSDAIKILRGFKDALIFGILIYSIKHIRKTKDCFDWKFVSLIITFIALLLFFYFVGNELKLTTEASSSSFDKTTALRSYLTPFVLLIFGMTIADDKVYLNKVIKALVIIGAVNGLIAIFEIFVLSPDFLVNIGYKDYLVEFNNLKDYQMGLFGLPFTYFTSTGLRRAGGLFSAGPLDMSNALLVIIPLSIASLIYINRNRFVTYLLFLLLSISALLLTISRVAIILSILQIVMIILFDSKINIKKIFTYLITGVFIIFTLGLFKSQELMHYLTDSISFEDPSSASHLLSFANAIDILSINPLGGVGLGNEIAESFYLNVWIETSFIGFLCVIGITLYFISKSFILSRTTDDPILKTIGLCCFCSWIGLSLEISKSIVGWATILSFCSAFFFAGVVMSYTKSIAK